MMLKKCKKINKKNLNNFSDFPKLKFYRYN